MHDIQIFNRQVNILLLYCILCKYVGNLTGITYESNYTLKDFWTFV